ncbi:MULTISPECIES: DUF2313 domain-containing protein [Paenibacillus]|uniref:DUF2313 domain-containing protein n=2 Tax=Paenibacillus TaxID=44249 RepID=A0AB36J6E0_9BACL|nr:DUF2313 domain-containing protein [Paenibacillus odorifer]MEC0131545.1 DUF2313 domain-containing protein [Paenibacillus odorifer]MEC0220302.1 DUF2313 domain-containing protein [Paenibacillus odorifer]OME11427.1 hypothetical protein BSK47_29045 [Paenibacillus odorifer]
MIPLRYREMLPPYWYEIDMADRHFSVFEKEMDDRLQTIDDLSNQFILRRSTWALWIWEWMYFRKTQEGSDDERREAIRRKRWGDRPFKLPLLRELGNQHGKLKNVSEDFLAKEIHFEFSLVQPFNMAGLQADFEYVHPVHIRRAVFSSAVPTQVINIKGTGYSHGVDFPICGFEVPFGGGE